MTATLFKGVFQMKIEPNEETGGGALKRQRYILSNLGLFYMILIALFGIPLLGTFVVVLIKGVLDFRYVILASGVIVLGLAVFYAGKFGLRLFRRMQRDGRKAFQDAAAQAGQGRPVQLELFNGLVTFSYGGRRPPAALPDIAAPAALLPDTRGGAADGPPSQPPPVNGVDQLRALVQLKEDGAIDAAEFIALKKKLIHEICHAPEGDPIPRPRQTPEAARVRIFPRN
jgi:hypothetical protein